jgi:hypothetical protein
MAAVQCLQSELMARTYDPVGVIDLRWEMSVCHLFASLNSREPNLGNPLLGRSRRRKRSTVLNRSATS